MDNLSSDQQPQQPEQPQQPADYYPPQPPQHAPISGQQPPIQPQPGYSPIPGQQPPTHPPANHPPAGGRQPDHAPQPQYIGSRPVDQAHRPWFKKKRLIIPASAVALLAVVSIAGAGVDPTPAAAPAQTSAPSNKPVAAASSKSATEPAPPPPAATEPTAESEPKPAEPEPSATDTETTAESTPEPAEPVHDVADYTCKELVGDVVRISGENENDTGNPSVIGVYKIKTVKDYQKAYRMGKREVPADETDVVVLRCSGIASLSNTYKQELKFTLSYDENEEVFVALNPVGGAY